MTTKEKLQAFAFEVAYPYIIKQPLIQDDFENLCYLLEGSAATGLYTEKSDVDTLLSLLGEISKIQYNDKSDEFLNIFENCCNCVL